MDTFPKMARGKKYVKSVAKNYDKILGGGVAISCSGMAKILDLTKVLVKVLEACWWDLIVLRDQYQVQITSNLEILKALKPF